MTTLAGAGIITAFLVGCGKNTPTQTGTPAAPSANVVTLAVKNSFAEVTSHLDPGGNLYMYLGTAQMAGRGCPAGWPRGAELFRPCRT